MAQLGEQSNTLLDKLTGNGEDISTLTKTVGRGVPALRDASENVLELVPASRVPLLVSSVNDVGVTYDNGWVKVTDSTGQEGRWLGAENVIAGDYAAGIQSNGLVYGETLQASVNIHAGNGVYSTVSSAIQVDAQRVYCGGALHNTGGFGIGNSWLNTNEVFASNGYLGGVHINGGGINPGGRGIWNAGTVDGALHVAGAASFTGNGFTGPGANIGGMFFNAGGVQPNGRGVWNAGVVDAAVHVSGSASFNGGGFTGPGASLGGVAINGGGIDLWGRNLVGYNFYCAGINASSGGAFFNLAYAFLVPYSDRRMKHDIADLDEAEALDNLLAMRPREFVWNDHEDRGRVRGFIADEMPDRLQRTHEGRGDGESALGGYDLGEVVTTTVVAAQTLFRDLDEATDRITALERRVRALEAL